MTIYNDKKFVELLFSTRSETDVYDIINSHGKEWKWEPVGGRENAGSIEMGSEPSDALAERITNGIDALIERKFLENGGNANSDLPKSPRESIEKWFKIKNGDISKITDSERRKLAENLTVTLLESANLSKRDQPIWTKLKSSPTVVITDQGVGQHPDRFKKTFVSINENNKVGMHFLIGSYGQGGATVYGFDKYTIIISRRPTSLLEPEQNDEVGFTIVRCNSRDPTSFKKPIYEYCIDETGKILRFSTDLLPASFVDGTMIRMIEFDLPSHSTIYTAPAGSLWWLSHNCLFDTVLPFLIFDQRSKRFPTLSDTDAKLGKIVAGNSYRLMVTGTKIRKVKDKEKSETGVQEALIYSSGGWELNLQNAGIADVRWWVCTKKASVVNFVEKSQPIVITLNGQRQILISKPELTLRGLDFVKDRLIVQVIGDKLTSEGQRIFSSTRDRARKNSIFINLLQQLSLSLMADEELKRVERELKEKTLSEETTEQEEKAKEILAQLLDQEEKSKNKANPVYNDNPQLPPLPREKNPLPPEPGPDDDEPPVPSPEIELQTMPTEIKILNVKDPIPIEVGGRAIVRIFLNANDDFFTRDEKPGILNCSIDPSENILIKATSRLNDGRISIILEANKDAKEAQNFNLSIGVSVPGLLNIVAPTRTLLIISVKKKRRGDIGNNTNPRPKAPEIRFVNKDDEKWKELEWTDRSVAEFKDNTVFVSLSNRYIEAALSAAKVGELTLKRYQSRYGAHIAMFTILQKKNEDSLSTTLPDGYKDLEMERAARTVIRAVALNIDETAE